MNWRNIKGFCAMAVQMVREELWGFCWEGSRGKSKKN